MMVLRFFQPACRRTWKPLAISSSAALPEDGSAAPNTHASLWLPAPPPPQIPPPHHTYASHVNILPFKFLLSRTKGGHGGSSTEDDVFVG
jgi:hypothetical protein